MNIVPGDLISFPTKVTVSLFLTRGRNNHCMEAARPIEGTHGGFPSAIHARVLVLAWPLTERRTTVLSNSLDLRTSCVKEGYFRHLTGSRRDARYTHRLSAHYAVNAELMSVPFTW